MDKESGSNPKESDSRVYKYTAPRPIWQQRSRDDVPAGEGVNPTLLLEILGYEVKLSAEQPSVETSINANDAVDKAGGMELQGG